MHKWPILVVATSTVLLISTFCCRSDSRSDRMFRPPKQNVAPTAEDYTKAEIADLPRAAAAENPEQASEIIRLHKYLHEKSIHDLTQYSFLDKPCDQIDCGVIKNEKASKIVSGVIQQKQTEETLSSGKQQGISAMISGVFAGVSLLISIVTMFQQRKLRSRIFT